MYLCKAAHRSRMSLPRMAEIMEPLRALLKERMEGPPGRTASVTRNRDITRGASTDDLALACKVAQDLVTCEITLYRPRHHFEIFIFPDALHISIRVVS